MEIRVGGRVICDEMACASIGFQPAYTFVAYFFRIAEEDRFLNRRLS
jgi:hypothetical protein